MKAAHPDGTMLRRGVLLLLENTKNAVKLVKNVASLE